METDLFIKHIKTYIWKFRLRPSSRLPIVRWMYWQRVERLRRLGKPIVHFLHQRKSGGTAIKYVLRKQKITDRYVIETHGHDVKLNNIPPGDKVFFFVRDPITRFVSGFNSSKRNQVLRTKDKSKLNTYASPNELALDLYSDDLAKRLKAEAAMKGIKHLAYSYWDCFLDDEYFRSRSKDILFIGFQESLNEDFQKLKEALHLYNDCQLPQDPFLANRAPETQGTALDEQAIKNLQKWYEKDLYFYELSRAISRQINANSNT